VPPVLEALDQLLAPYGSLGAYGRSEQMSHRFLSDEIAQQGLMATTIPPVFLGVAAFLLHVVLTRVVATQREQIATLKALGYDTVTIGLHYLKLVTVITLLGSAAGITLGTWFGREMTRSYVMFFRFPVLAFRVAPWIPLLATGVSLVAAIFAAYGGVRRVVALAPAEAMRPPVPPVYRHSFLERLGLGQWLSPPGRMVLRNMARRPLRALLTACGMALAVPLILLALFWRDAMAYMITVQFSAVDRSDVRVSFTDPVAMRAQRELARIPGVMYTEAFRSVPVRLRAGHRTYRTGILGLPHDGRLHRLMDPALHPIPIPPEGVLLTDRLGERLGVRVGDSLSVEVLEGERPRRNVVVVGLVNDLVGMSAYMDRTALNRLMREGETISTVALTIDGTRADEIYAQLKQLPKVATVSIKRTALKSFTETTATFVLVFTGILTGFAIIIAVGVVYNNARIALAERAWELASWRVLGATRQEVSRVLLAELTLEMLLAMPLGLWLGHLAVVALAQAHVTEDFNIPPIIAPRTYALAACAILLAGVASAWVVQRRIKQLDLVSVLKTRE
jgi:putative ABC transport system permease protein